MKLGIDIGVDIARAAFLDAEQHPVLVTVAPDRTALPALVRQTLRGVETGVAAEHALIGNAETTLTGCTRLMGGRATWPDQLLQRLPFAVEERDGLAVCNLLYAEMSPATAYKYLVKALVQSAEIQTGAEVESIVLTVPAGAEHHMRVMAREAVEQAGWPVERIVNQPTAALLAADVPPQAHRVAVVNCGIGSIDVSLADCSAQQPRITCTVSDMMFGSDDLAWVVVDHLVQRFRQTHHVDIAATDRGGFARWGLKRAVDEAFWRFKTLPHVDIILDHGGGFGRDLATILHRSDVDAWIAPQINHVRLLCEQAIARARWSMAAIDAVVLIGESAALPMLHEAIAQIFQKPISALSTQSADSLAVQGAALLSAATNPLIWDVTPYPLGISCYIGDQELLSTIVPANTPIPTTEAGFTQSYRTHLPNQTEVRLDLLHYRGLRNPGPDKVTPHECEVLATWLFSGLRPRKGKHANFTVNFRIDQNGIVHVSAEETATGHRLNVETRRSL